MMTSFRPARALAALLGLALAACDHGSMGADEMSVRRFAAELEQEVARMRPHVAAMRQQSPAQWRADVGEHARRVEQMLERLDRIMGEMQQTSGMTAGMGTSMGPSGMAEAMGMNAEEHDGMLRLMSQLHADLRQLAAASEADLAERMPPHLDRLETMLQMIETSAERMRSMHHGR